MAECEQRFKEGDKRALLHAIYVCVCSYPQRAVPAWAQIAFSKAVGQVIQAKVGSWDDVFGQPVAERAARTEKKGLSAQRRYIRLKNEVWSFCWSRIHAGSSVRRTFKDAAMQLGCTQREARELYYAAKNGGWKPPMSPDEMWKRLEMWLAVAEAAQPGGKARQNSVEISNSAKQPAPKKVRRSIVTPKA